MADWMIEVTTSFKCDPKTYFVSMAILDKYLVASHQNQISLQNHDIHKIGVISMYLASKFEDVFPLHSKIVSEKIAHGTMTPKQITTEEKKFFKLLGFSLDFVTHYDFFETYVAKMQYRFNQLCVQENEQ